LASVSLSARSRFGLPIYILPRLPF
jgi:hypothetical protein